MEYDQMDWDYYEFGRDEAQEKAVLAGIAKYND
jgi:hypothetical protein